MSESYPRQFHDDRAAYGLGASIPPEAPATPGGDIFHDSLREMVQQRDETALTARYHAGLLDDQGEAVLEAMIRDRLEQDRLLAQRNPASRYKYVVVREFHDYLLGRRLAREGYGDGEPALATMRQMLSQIPDNPLITRQGEPAPQLPDWRLKTFMLSKLDSYPDINDRRRPYGSLSVAASATCVDDQLRTKRFLAALDTALEGLGADTDGPIEVYDAGCGALPILAVYAALSNERVRCTALELNPDSAAIARRIVAAFGLQDRIRVLETDATRYRPDKPVDLLVSETMHSGLIDEPMVDIMSNLQPAVRPGGVVLPSGVDVHSRLIPIDEYDKIEFYSHLASKPVKVFRDGWQTEVEYRAGDQLPLIAFDIPVASRALGSYMVGVCCTVWLGDAEPLQPYDSLITMPQSVSTESGQRRLLLDGVGTVQALRVRYRPGGRLSGALSTVVARD